MSLTIDSVYSSELPAYRDAVAALRIEVFRSWPYLYDGDLEYEKRYLDVYLQSKDAIWVLARSGDAIVGASTGLPLIDGDASFARPFVEAGISPAEVFYFGESVLRSDYRGRGVGHQFFDRREAHARTYQRFRMTAFAAVDRDPTDPRCPSDYFDLAPFWQRRGYVRQDRMRFAMAWKELGEAEESPKVLTYWRRPLSGAPRQR